MVSLPTSCATASPTAAQIFDPVFKGRCDNTNCHGGPLLPTLKRATDLPLMVGRSSASDLPLVDSGFNVNRSYLLYKLTGEVWKVPHGGGDAMPPTVDSSTTPVVPGRQLDPQRGADLRRRVAAAVVIAGRASTRRYRPLRPRTKLTISLALDGGHGKGFKKWRRRGQEARPVGLADAHAAVRKPHVTAGVVKGRRCSGPKSR